MKHSTALLVVAVAFCMLQHSYCVGESIDNLDAAIQAHFAIYDSTSSTVERLINTNIQGALNYIAKLTYGGKTDNPCVTAIIDRINALPPQVVVNIAECQNAEISYARAGITSILLNINDILIEVTTGSYCEGPESKEVLNKMWKDGLTGNRCNELAAIPETIVNYLAKIIDVLNIVFPIIVDCSAGTYSQGISEIFDLLGELKTCSKDHGNTY